MDGNNEKGNKMKENNDKALNFEKVTEYMDEESATNGDDPSTTPPTSEVVEKDKEEEKADQRNDNALNFEKMIALLNEVIATYCEDPLTAPATSGIAAMLRDEKKDDKQGESNDNTQNFEESRPLLDEARATLSDDSPTETTADVEEKEKIKMADRKKKIAANIAKAQEMLDKANAVVAQTDLPEDVAKSAKETQHFGEKLLYMMHYYMDMVDEVEQREKLEEFLRELEEDKRH